MSSSLLERYDKTHVKSINNAHWMCVTHGYNKARVAPAAAGRKRQAESPVGVDHPFHQVFPMETRWEQTCRIHAKKSGTKCGSDWNRYLTRDFVIQVCKLVVVCATEKFPKKTFQKRSDDSTWAKCYAPHFLLCNMQQINMLTTFIYEINLLPTRLNLQMSTLR